MVATRKMFERQVTHAARRYRMVSLKEIEDACAANRPLPARACLITFDDGWRDNYTVAFPILRRMGIPAAVFVTTDYIGTHKVFWFTRLMQSLLDRSTRALRTGDGHAAGCPPDVCNELNRLGAFPQPLRPLQIDPLIEILKRYPETHIDAMVAGLATRLNGAGTEPPGESYFLTWEQLREMEHGGISVGSHTCTHRILTQLSDPEAAEELRGSRERLERELGHRVVSFAFPNGDYAPRHITMAEQTGYRVFFISTRMQPGGPPGRIFPRPCLHDGVGRRPGGGFSPSLLEFHLAGVVDRLRNRMRP